MSMAAEIYAQAVFNRQVPVPGLGRMMVFVDGENMVCRFQDMLNKGKTPRPSLVHCR
jgi:hypothetical protein